MIVKHICATTSQLVNSRFVAVLHFSLVRFIIKYANCPPPGGGRRTASGVGITLRRRCRNGLYVGARRSINDDRFVTIFETAGLIVRNEDRDDVTDKHSIKPPDLINKNPSNKPEV